MELFGIVVSKPASWGARAGNRRRGAAHARDRGRSFSARALRFPHEALRAIAVVAEGRLAFRGTVEAYLAGAREETRERTPPPVDLGSWDEALDPSVLLVELIDGSVRYADLVVFEHLDFRVGVGQHTLVEGPNGSGKSTLLEMVSGDHPQAYSNELYLVGRRRGTPARRSGTSNATLAWSLPACIGTIASAAALRRCC